ncbi:hypothetical protein [Sanguibacter sp. Z1732]|uniref:hypothetical protein n=1 Tax=Sanguibacter sp. Z1732 TaxID=3435412 RepID=UPI003D9C8135
MSTPSTRLSTRMRIGIWDFSSVPGVVCERPPGSILARSGANRRSIVAALIRESNSALATPRGCSRTRWFGEHKGIPARSRSA